MSSIADAFPDLAAALIAQLEREDKYKLALELKSAKVRAVSFDPDANAGCIALDAARDLNVVETNVIGIKHLATVSLTEVFDAHMDIDNFERPMAIEVLFPPESLRLALQNWRAV